MDYIEILNKIIEYEKKDNYDRLKLLIINKSVDLGLDYTLFFPSTINTFLLYLVGHPIENYLCKIFIEKDKEFIKKYIYEDFKLFHLKIENKILNDDLKKEYEYILKNYSENFLEIWFSYNNVIVQIILVINSLLDLNTLQYVYKYDYSIFNSILLNIYILILALNSIKFIENELSIDRKDYLNYKNNLYEEINHLLDNFFFIKEVDNYKFHTDKIIENIDILIDEIYENFIGMPSSLNGKIRNMYQTERWYNFIFFLLTPFNPILSRHINNSIRGRIKKLIDVVIVLQKKLIDNSIYYKILNELIDKKDIKDLYLSDSEILFKISNISHSYHENVLFDDISIKIPKNKWVFLYGNSGDGKSTLCNFLMKKNKCSSGKIHYMGLYDDYIFDDIKKDISFINLNSDIFNNYSILFNLTYCVKNIDYNIIYYYLKLFNMEKYIDKLNDNVNFLSTGEKQRIKLIRLILHDKPIWFLDESTSNINTELEIIVIKELKRIQELKKKSVVFICHNPNIIQYSDYIIKIKNKKIYIEKIIL